MDNDLSKPTPASRLFHLDNFRTYLTMLVIYHHTSIPYGGAGSWPYSSRFHTPESSPTLIAFTALNQSYFMGSFFFLSGTMSCSALSRKGRKEFLKSKWLRLGVPIAVYTLLAPPIQIAILRSLQGNELNIGDLVTYWKGLRGVKGPLWYTALLLVCDTLYSFVPYLALQNFTNFYPLAAFIVDIAASFLVRLWWPVGATFVPLNLQPSFLPQYIACYLIGTARNSASPPVLNRANKITLLVSSVASSISIPALLHKYPNVYTNDSVRGGFNLLALSYAIWNEVTGYLLGTAIMGLFTSSMWLNGSWGCVWRYSYAAYLIHPIVVVGTQACADGWNASGVLKTIFIGTTGVLGSWGLSWGLLRIPGVKTVLG